MPVAPHAAVIPGKFYHTGEQTLAAQRATFARCGKHDLFRWYIAYTESINLMDYSAAVIPVTRADKSVDRFDHQYQPLNEVDRKNWEACKWIMQLGYHCDQLTEVSKMTPRPTMARL